MIRRTLGVAPGTRLPSAHEVGEIVWFLVGPSPEWRRRHGR